MTQEAEPRGGTFRPKLAFDPVRLQQGDRRRLSLRRIASVSAPCQSQRGFIKAPASVRQLLERLWHNNLFSWHQETVWFAAQARQGLRVLTSLWFIYFNSVSLHSGMIMFYAPQLQGALSLAASTFITVSTVHLVIQGNHHSDSFTPRSYLRSTLLLESERFMLIKHKTVVLAEALFSFLFCVQEYQGSSVLGQFVTRFLLRETSTQLQSLQLSLDCATEAVHDQGCTGRRAPKKPEELPIQRAAKRPSRRTQKNMCLSPTDPYSGMLTTGRGPAEALCGANEAPCGMTLQGFFVLLLGSGVSVEPDNHWGSQINQLEQLIDKLECEVCMQFALKSLKPPLLGFRYAQLTRSTGQ